MSTDLIEAGSHPQPYFYPQLMDRQYIVEDDHIPFLEKSKSTYSLQIFC